MNKENLSLLIIAISDRSKPVSMGHFVLDRTHSNRFEDCLGDLMETAPEENTITLRCDTVCCIAGWGSVLQHKGNIAAAVEDEGDYVGQLAKFLDIRYDMAEALAYADVAVDPKVKLDEDLFLKEDWNDDVSTSRVLGPHALLGVISRSAMVAALQILHDTGILDWRKAMRAAGQEDLIQVEE